MSGATTVIGIILDSAGEYFEQHGLANAAAILGILSGQIEEVDASLQENPTLEVAAVVAGLIAGAALGPTAAAATITESIGGVIAPLVGGASTQVATVITNYLIGLGAENLYIAAQNTLNSIATNLGGTLTSITVPSSTLLPPSNSSSNPNIMVASAPDSSGNTGELLINLPVPSQDASTTNIVTANNSAMAPGSPGYQTNEYTGSTISFSSGGQQYAATVSYAYYDSQSNLIYVYDKVAPNNNPSGNIFGVGDIKASQATITPPSGSVPEVLSTQVTNNANGSQTVQNFGSNGSVQYTETDNTAANGQLTAIITGQGDIANLSNTSVAVSDSTLATLRGKGDSVTAGNSDNLTVDSSSSSVSTSETGTGTTITDNGAGDYALLQGSSNTTTMSGSNSSAFASGNSDTTAFTGANAIGGASGTGDGFTLFGSGSSASTTGSGDGVALEGASESGTLSGANSAGFAYNTGDYLDLKGNSDNATLSGSTDSAYASGNNDTTTSTGASATLGADGTGDGFTMYGTGSTAVVTGAGDGVAMEGNDETATLSGTSQATFEYGVSDDATLGSTDNGWMDSAATGSSFSATSLLSGETVNTSVTEGSSGAITFTDHASGSGSGDYNFSGSSQLTGTTNNDLDSTSYHGTPFLDDNANLSAGGSDSSIFGFNNNIIETGAVYTGANAGGLLGTAGISLVDGVLVDDYFNYNNSNVETGFQEDWYVPNGSGYNQVYANYNASGGYISGDDGGALRNDGGYGSGGEFELAQSASTTGTNISSIAQFDATLPQNATAVQNAQTASDEVNLLFTKNAANNNYATALYEGVKWNKSDVITWSLADSSGSAASPFSSYMTAGSQFDALIEKAFQTWAAASGLTFEEVADSSQSDIRIGWGDFNTGSSGVVGYTTYQNEGTQLDPNLIIRLEDPSQNALVTGTNGNLSYSGTQASLYQVLLHEVGHALGLADNDDPNSVMYYNASASNTTLDSNDIAGMKTLYGSSQPSSAVTQEIQSDASSVAGMSINSMLVQLAQATASFVAHNPSAAASTTPDLSLAAAQMMTPTLITANAMH